MRTKVPHCSRCKNKVNMNKGLRLGDNEWMHEACYDKMLKEMTSKGIVA